MDKRELSAGAEKVEILSSRTGGEERRKAEREQQRAAARIEAAKEKREQAMKRAEHAAEKKHARRERAAAQEEARQHRRAARAERRVQKREQEQKRAPGFGGWLAAVIALSLAVLALGAIVTVGFFDLNEARGAITHSYRAGVYELSEHVENMSADLAKVRVADAGAEMQKLLTDLLVESELAEADLESFPAGEQGAQSLTAFFNRVSAFAGSALRRAAAGEPLTARDRAALEHMYEVTERVRAGMPALVESTDVSLRDLLAPEGDFAASLRALDEAAAEEPHARPERHTMLAGMDEIGEEQALERAQAYFEEYRPADLRVTGKTERGERACYDVQFRDGEGNEYFAQITVRGGMLALLESYRACGGENFDAPRAAEIAGSFLEKCGYSGMTPVWASEAGGECCVQFCFEQNGVLMYPDMIRVKVCLERGIVTGMEANGFLRSHRERTVGQAQVAEETVRENAAARMDELEEVRLAVIPANGRERLVYEVRGMYGGRQYFAYVDAETGETCEIRVVVPTDRGDDLR